jgi:phospholipid/cholesterol/gamma-HCH transport system substrate-binding protein
MTELHRQRLSREQRAERRHLRAAALAAAALVAITALVFVVQARIGRSSYTISGLFSSAAGLSQGSPVRIGGVDVGEVTGVERGPAHTARVRLNISDRGQPVHTDATLAITPRLVLEGSAYVKLSPGTPEAPVLRSGATIGQDRTSVAVQFDQFLSTFTAPARRAMQDTFKGLAEGFADAPGVRAAVGSLARELPSIAAASRASQGTDDDDLRRMLASMRDMSAQMGADPPSLSGMVAHFNDLMGALAAEERPLGQTVVELNRVFRAAPRPLAAIDKALPTVERFGRELTPVLRAAPRPLQASTEMLRQVELLSRPREAPALLRRTGPLVANAARMTERLGPTVRLVTPLDQCISQRVVPVLNQEVPDGALSTGDPAWLDLFHATASFASVTGGFDGNGAAIRFGFTGGASSAQGVLPGLGLVDGVGPAIQGVRPPWLGFNVEPPYRPDAWCKDQPLARLAADPAPPPAWAQRERTGR